MREKIAKVNKIIWQIITSKQSKIITQLTLMITFMLICKSAFADDVEDPLAGTAASLIATLKNNGVGRVFIYLTAGILAIAAYIKTHNLLYFGGIIAIAVFLNVLFKMAGVA